MDMTTFVESCVETAAGSAARAERKSRANPRARRLLKLLRGKQRILVTTHMHPDPDALASAYAMSQLIRHECPKAAIRVSVKGQIGGGINEAFTRYTKLQLTRWRDSALSRYDAIILVDTQPMFAFSPLPQGILPTAVIDHHVARGRKARLRFSDVRPDVGATSSIVFSYFMELDVPIAPDLAATLLYAIESDLAGAAGTPTELDNMALSSLTLIADTHTLYKMRHVDLPQSYYQSYATALSNATFYDHAIFAHLDEIDSLEKPAVIADFLLRFDQVDWALVSAVHGKRLILSLRTSDKERSAGEIMRKLVRRIGEGGGHRTKAGGFVRLETGSESAIERHRATVRRRLLDALNIRNSRGQKLVPKPVAV